MYECVKEEGSELELGLLYVLTDVKHDFFGSDFTCKMYKVDYYRKKTPM